MHRRTKKKNLMSVKVFHTLSRKESVGLLYPTQKLVYMLHITQIISKHAFVCVHERNRIF